MNRNHVALLNELRNNSRQSLNKISKTVCVPVSTLVDALKRIEQDYVIKHVPLLNYKEIGYHTHVHLAIKTLDKPKLLRLLNQSKNVNSISKVMNGHDYMVEAIFKDLSEYSEFKEKIIPAVSEILELPVVEEIRKEKFMAPKIL